MMAWLDLLALGGGDAMPVLPSLGAMSLWRSVGWALVLASLAWNGAWGLGRLPLRWRAGLAVLVAVAVLLPGPRGGSHWLGLAFQAPSLVSVGLAAATLWPFARQKVSPEPTLVFSLLAVAMGWCLLLDTLALLPAFLYPWGYGRTALLALLAVAVLLTAWPATRRAGFAALGLALVFTVTRLPSGNLWDALLDPWLWLWAHGVAVRSAFGMWHRSRPGRRG